MVQLFVKKRYNTPEEKALFNAIEELDEDKDKLVEYAEGLHSADIDLETELVLNGIIYPALTESYNLMRKLVKDEYDINISKEIDWDKILYEKQDKFEKIVKDHTKAFILFGDDNKFIRQMSLVLDTETVSIFNKGMYEELKDICDYAIVTGAVEGGCPKCFHGEVPIAELKLPPYHPGCECIVRYHEKGTEELA